MLNWIRALGEQVAELKSAEQVVYADMDEMHTYVDQKKAINGYGLLLIDMGINSSTSLLVTGARCPDRTKALGRD